MKLKVGQKAPEFELPDQDGKMRRLADYRGKKVLLYFYPRDNTPGCTVEACEFRDNIKEISKAGLAVLGVSADSVASHKKFSDKFNLPFSILSDPEKKVIKSYGAWGKKKFLGREYFGILRSSFLIDENGKLAKIYEKVKPAVHTSEVLDGIITEKI